MRSTTTITAVRPLRSRFLLARTSDERLREQLQGGNEVAFEVLFDRHHGALLSFCRHLLGSLEAAEDAVQLTFLSAYRQLCTPGRRINHLKPWLFTVAHNRCVSILRSRREAPSAELPERVSVAGLSEQVEAREDIRHLLVDLAELPVDQRAALLLAETRGLSHEEISRVLNCEAKQVKSLVFQARSQLIERRTARDTPCAEFREQIALGGPALRRGPVRSHVKACPECGDYRQQVRRQRALMGLALPVLPSPGFRDSVLAGAASVGGGGTTGALVIGVASKAGGAAASGAGGGVLGGGGLIGGSAMGGGIGATALAAVTGAGKVALVALAATGAAIGGEAVVTEGYERVTTRDDSSRGIGENRGSERVGRGEGRSSNGPGRRAGRRPSRRGPEPPSRRGRAAESRDHGGRRNASERPDPPAYGGTRAKRDRGTDRSDSPAQNPSSTRSEAGKGGGRPAASQHEATAELGAPKPPSVPHSRTPPEVLDAPGVKDIAPKLREGPRAP